MFTHKIKNSENYISRFVSEIVNDTGMYRASGCKDLL